MRDGVVYQGTLAQATVDALLGARFGDVFAVLGPHRLPDGKDYIVRALLPQADAVSLIDRATGACMAQMHRTHPGGLFEARLSERPDYRLQWRQGDMLHQHEDAYRFDTLLDPQSVYLFSEGTEERAYRWMGAHGRHVDGVDGVHFTVWAPNAARVSVVGDFNHWDGRRHVMRRHPASGLWDIFIPAVPNLAHYKYEIVDASGNLLPLKADPYAFSMQHPPDTAARIVASAGFPWSDAGWLAARPQHQGLDRPLSVYEVHVGSWRRRHSEGNRYLSYPELADELIPYVQDLGFTHIQLMPISEFPFDGSWGYQPVGLYAPSIRFGTPDEFRHFVDRCHAAGLGVLLDWVPGHFPSDPHGLANFDGSCLYEHEDVRLGYHPDWNTLIYNYGRAEVISFLVSNAHYWLDEFHIDGLRVDAVASMLYLDYSRREGEWLPNIHGGRENLEAIALLRRVNSRVHRNFSGVLMIAEESTAWGGVSRPVHEGGLGFDYKWNMGWMNDTLRHIRRDPVYRQYHHNEMTFGLMYAFSEHFMLPLSHDEVVHGKGSLLSRMPGDDWQRFANLRAYLAFMWAHPGKKLLFMGGEWGQWREWNHDRGLDWHLLEQPRHRGLQRLVGDLNRLYCTLPALSENDTRPAGFEWVQVDNSRQSVFAWLRRGCSPDALVLLVVNFTPTTYPRYRVGVPRQGFYRERINTDAEFYGGSNVGNQGGLPARHEPCDGQPWALTMALPPLAAILFEWCPA